VLGGARPPPLIPNHAPASAGSAFETRRILWGAAWVAPHLTPWVEQWDQAKAPRLPLSLPLLHPQDPRSRAHQRALHRHPGALGRCSPAQRSPSQDSGHTGHWQAQLRRPRGGILLAGDVQHHQPPRNGWPSQLARAPPLPPPERLPQAQTWVQASQSQGLHPYPDLHLHLEPGIGDGSWSTSGRHHGLC
jgi:hypothetical protein